MNEGEAYRMLRESVDAILRGSAEAREAFEAMLGLGRGEAEAREEIARVLMAVMYHVGAESTRVRAAGGGAPLRREAFARLAAGETAREIFDRPREAGAGGAAPPEPGTTEREGSA